MSAIELGKRYERLLMSSAPLAIAAAFLLFSSMASKDQKTITLGRCYEVAAQMIAANRKDLQSNWKEWEAKRGRKDRLIVYNPYEFALGRAWIRPSLYKDCEVLTPEVTASINTAPEELESKWIADSKRYKDAPIEMNGVTIESQTEISILGTKVRVRLSTLTTALQFAIGPLLLLWLGSLYNTRFRESIHNARSSSLIYVYPHLMNMYPSFSIPSLRKRARVALWISPRNAAAVVYTIFRMFLVCVVLAPTVVLYVWSLALIPIESMGLAHLILGILVCLFALAVVMVEAMPWHWSKVFPQVEPS